MQRAPFSFSLSLTLFYRKGRVTYENAERIEMGSNSYRCAVYSLRDRSTGDPGDHAEDTGVSDRYRTDRAGLVSIICYLLRDARENYYHNEFVFGILGIVLGAVVLYKVEIVISLIPFILGVLVLCSGCSKLQDAIDLKRLGYGSWLGLLIVAAINIILGVVLIYNPFKAAILLFRVLGVVLILSGAGDCFSTIYFARKLRRFKQEQDALDSTFEEVDPKDQN